MLAKYIYKPGSNAADITADLINILTGAFVPTGGGANASASCDTSQTTYINTVAAGWTAEPIYAMDLQKLSMPANATTGTLALRPVSNGSYILWPVQGTNQVLKSTDDGLTWTAYTLPGTLTAFTPPNGAACNLCFVGGSINKWVMTNPGTTATTVWTSSDGQTWASVTMSNSPVAQQWGQPVYANNILIITSLGISAGQAHKNVRLKKLFFP